jgi:hypothetical protein
MLSIEEFTCGSLGDAQPLALMLPRTQHEEAILVGHAGQRRVAMFLGSSHRFQCFEYDTNEHWAGLIIKGVAIEVDETAVFDPNYGGSPLGSLVRQDTRLCICASEERSIGRGHATISLMDNLERAPERHRAGFLRWQIVIGRGIEKRVLQVIDVRLKD